MVGIFLPPPDDEAQSKETKPLTGYMDSEQSSSDPMLGVLVTDEYPEGVSAWNAVDDSNLLPPLQNSLSIETGISGRSGGSFTFTDNSVPLSSYKPVPPILGVAETKLQLDVEWTKSLDIYGLLREFTLLTNKLSTEANALRGPLLARDKKLLEVAFMAQSRKDYLALKDECMSAEQKHKISLDKSKLDKKAKEKALKRAKKIETSLRKELLDEQKKEAEERQRQAELEELAYSSQEELEESLEESTALVDTVDSSATSPSKKSKKSKKKD